MSEGRAFAKINLSLCIVGKRDNLHLLDMIVVPYKKYCDTVAFTPDNGVKGLVVDSISSRFDSLDKQRFAHVLKDKLDVISNYYKLNGYVTIDKGVPLGGGLGGSTASIVALLRAVEEISKKRADSRLLVSLGSDVPCMYFGTPCRVQGVGEQVTPVEMDCLFELEDYLVEGGVDSKEAYEAFDRWLDGLSEGDRQAFENKKVPTGILEAIELMRNDLQVVACALNKNILTTLATLKGKVMMTGSGSTLIKIKSVKRLD